MQARRSLCFSILGLHERHVLGRPLPASTGSCNCSNEDFGGAQNWRAQGFGVCGVGASLTKVYRMSFRAPE